MTSWRAWVLFCALLIACGSRLAGRNSGGPDASEDAADEYGGSIPITGVSVIDDATVGGGPGADAAEEDDLGPMPPFDAGPGGICDEPLAPGDLMIDELMIKSVAGTGDHGQWLEVQSTLDCAIDLVGLHGEAPRGAKVAAFDVTGDLWLPARGTFVIADSTDPAINHYLPGTVVAWSGNIGDVLRAKGDTVTLLSNGVVIDTLTYPVVPFTIGASIEFPSDCDAAMRSDWTLWMTSNASWFPGFFGTPNAPNTDVTCAALGDP